MSPPVDKASQETLNKLMAAFKRAATSTDDTEPELDTSPILFKVTHEWVLRWIADAHPDYLPFITKGYVLTSQGVTLVSNTRHASDLYHETLPEYTLLDPFPERYTGSVVIDRGEVSSSPRRPDPRDPLGSLRSKGSDISEPILEESESAEFTPLPESAAAEYKERPQKLNDTNREICRNLLKLVKHQGEASRLEQASLGLGRNILRLWQARREELDQDGEYDAIINSLIRCWCNDGLDAANFTSFSDWANVLDAMIRSRSSLIHTDEQEIGNMYVEAVSTLSEDIRRDLKTEMRFAKVANRTSGHLDLDSSVVCIEAVLTKHEGETLKATAAALLGTGGSGARALIGKDANKSISEASRGVSEGAAPPLRNYGIMSLLVVPAQY